MKINMKTNIQILLLAATLFVISIVIVLLDIDLLNCYFNPWQVASFDLVLIIMMAVMYVVVRTKQIRKFDNQNREDYYG
jgi:magnesium-transporting ATPase (P-type)